MYVHTQLYAFCIYRKDLQYVADENRTKCVDVHYLSKKLFKFQTTFRDLLICIVPLCIVIPTNVAIIVKLIQHRKLMNELGSSSKADDTTKATIMLLSITIAYVVLMVPMMITIVIYTYSQAGSYYHVIIILSNLPYLNMSINFYLYFLSGKMFRYKVKEMFQRCLKPYLTFVKNKHHGTIQVSSSPISEALLLKNYRDQRSDSH